MPMQLDTGAIKAESRSLLRTGEVNPFRMTLFYLLITLVLDMINSGVSYMIDSAGGFTVLSFSFVSILVGLVALVLNAGYYCYCFGILRREEMPYESLFDAFPFAGKVILLSIVEGVFIFRGRCFSSSPASSRPTATRSPCSTCAKIPSSA